MRSFRSYALFACALAAIAGCATAGPGTNNNNNVPDAKPLPGTPDAMPPGTPDAMPPGTPDAMPPGTPDAMPMQVTMNEASSSAIVVGNTVACNANNITAENSYYRAFRPSDFGVSGAFHVSSVGFAIETAVAGAGTQSVTVNVYSYTGTVGGTNLDTASMTQIGTASVVVPDTSTGEMLNANVTGTVPSGQNVVVEILVPDGNAAGNQLFIGSNTGSETLPGYIRAPDCSTPTPTALTSLQLTSQMSMIITVTGTYP